MAPPAEKTPSWFRLPKPTVTAYALAVLFVVFWILEARTFPSGTPIIHRGDEGVFWSQAQAPFFSKAFFTSGRPFTTPFLYKIFKNDEAAICHFQSRLSVVCWFALAVVVASCFRHPISRLLSAVLICAFSLTFPINQWDYVARSESITLSLLVLWGAMTFWVAKLVIADQKRMVLSLMPFWGALSLLATSTRDSMSYIFLSAALAFSAWGLLNAALEIRKRNFRGVKYLLFLCAAIQFAVFGYAAWSLKASRVRWHTPLLNVILIRVLADPRIYAYWTAKLGFPENHEFEKLSGKMSWTAVPPYDNISIMLAADPKLADVRDFLDREGVAFYRRYLLSDWRHTIPDAHLIMKEHANDLYSRFREGLARNRLGHYLTQYLYPRLTDRPLRVFFIVALACGIAAIIGHGLRPLALMALFLLLNGWSQGFICFHGDTSDLQRHMFVSAFLSRLGLVIAVLIIAQALGFILRLKAVEERMQRMGIAWPAVNKPDAVNVGNENQKPRRKKSASKKAKSNNR